MALLVKRAGQDQYGNRIKVLLAGEPGSGKTRMSSTFPDVIYANAEAGLMSVVDRQPAFIDITSTEQLNELRIQLAQAPQAREKLLGVPVQTVIIDTLDSIQRMLVAERLKEEKKEAMAIADWGWLGDQLRAIVRAYRNLDLHVVFTVHVRTVEDSETGQTFVKSALQGAMQDEIAQYVDLAVLLRAQPTSKIVNGESRRVLTRILQTSPDSRHPWLKDRSGKLPMEMEITLNDDFFRIHSLIFPKEPRVAPSVVAPPAPVPAPTPGAARAAREALKRPAQPPATSMAVADPPTAVAAAPDAAEVPAEIPSPEMETVTEAQSETLEEVAPESAHPLNGNGSAPAAEDSSPASTGTSAEAPKVCEVCGTEVESADQVELGLIRFRQVLCRAHFVAKKTAKR